MPRSEVAPSMTEVGSTTEQRIVRPSREQAFLEAKRIAQERISAAVKASPSTVASSILRCVLMPPGRSHTGEVVKKLNAKLPSALQARLNRGLHSRDAVLSRLAKTAGTATGTGRHWTEQPLSGMTASAWSVFRSEVGIEVETVKFLRRDSSTHWRGEHPIPPIRCWAEANLQPALEDAVSAAFEFPTAIQSQCLPVMMWRGISESHRMDLLAVSETGGGKTLAYLVPALHDILSPRCPRLIGNEELLSLGPFLLVVVPTRELAEQVFVGAQRLLSQIASASKALSGSDGVSPLLIPSNRIEELRVVKVIGEEKLDVLHEELAKGAHIVVGTVGQLHSLLQNRFLSLGNVRTLVVDEVDRMLDDNLRGYLDAVVAQANGTHQTALFTATLSSDRAQIAQRYFSPDGYYLVRTPYRCPTVMQCFEAVPNTVDVTPDQDHDVVLHPGKFSRLVHWLLHGTRPIIVFANEKKTCDALSEALASEADRLEQYSDAALKNVAKAPPSSMAFLREQGRPLNDSPCVNNLKSIAVVHSDLTQNERNRLVESFQNGKRAVLLTTDLLGRGLDVSGVTLVVNYDMPRARGITVEEARSQYIHRIGRTGRAGLHGVSTSFLCLPTGAFSQRQKALEDADETSDDDSDTEPSAQRRRGEGNDRCFPEDSAILPLLWTFLVDIVRSNGYRDPEKVLRANRFERIYLADALASVLQGESAGNRFNSIQV